MDDAFVEKRFCSTKMKEYDIQISQYEEYLNSPEMKEKALRLKALREKLGNITREKEIIY